MRAVIIETVSGVHGGADIGLKVTMSRFTHGPPNGFGLSSGTKALRWAGYVDAPPPMVVPVLMLK